MSKLKSTPATHNVKTLEDLTRYVSTFIQDVFDTVNGKLELKSNLWTDFQEVIFTAANTETQVAHDLQKVPTGYMLAGADAATSLYDGPTKWTRTHIYLKASVATTARIVIF